MAEVLHAVQGTAQSAASTIPANTSLQPGDYSVSPGHMRSQFCGILLLPGRDRSANNRCSSQCYQTLPREQITDKFLWGRLEPMLGYLSAEQRSKVLEGLNLAFDSHSGQVSVS